MMTQATPEKIWTSAQEHLRSMLSADTYNLWFSALRACGAEGSTLLLEVSNDFCEVWLKDNYMGLLEDVVALASGKQLNVKFKVASSVGSLGPAVAAQPPPAKAKAIEPPAEKMPLMQDPGFNPKTPLKPSSSATTTILRMPPHSPSPRRPANPITRASFMAASVWEKRTCSTPLATM